MICTLRHKGDFSWGQTLTWKESQLGNCTDVKFVLNHNISVAVVSNSYNDFCPRKINVNFGQDYNFETDRIPMEVRDYSGYYHQDDWKQLHKIA